MGGERDALGAQLVRRNEELRLLYEKIKIQQSTLAKGQAQYRERLAEIRVLRIKVGALQMELGQLRSSVANADVLKREVHHLNRELLTERTKVKALSEELENPLNVHRWGLGMGGGWRWRCGRGGRGWVGVGWVL